MISSLWWRSEAKKRGTNRKEAKVQITSSVRLREWYIVDAIWKQCSVQSSAEKTSCSMKNGVGFPLKELDNAVIYTQKADSAKTTISLGNIWT